jgi:hypothetical protein
MTAAKKEFTVGAGADYKKWDCEEMYPRPKQVDLGVPKWLGGITSVAKKGFAIYNQVKSLIPGGTKAGAGLVPGSSEFEEELEI